MRSGRHSSFVVLLLCTLIVLVASARSVHEQLLADGDTGACEYCPQESDLIPPLLVALPAMMLDMAPQILMGFIAPRHLVSDANYALPEVVASR